MDGVLLTKVLKTDKTGPAEYGRKTVFSRFLQFINQFSSVLKTGTVLIFESLSSLKDEPRDQADTSQVCEALLTLFVEVAQKRRHEVVMKDD
jgi:hypothetical protein